MKPIAYRQLSLKPWEFFAMTIYEFHEQLDGWLWRHKREQEKLATFITIPLVNSGMNAPKRGLTVEKFLGRPVGDEAPKNEVTDAQYFVNKFNIPKKYLSPKVLAKGGKNG